MRIAVKFGATGHDHAFDVRQPLTRQAAGPILVRRLVKIFAPAILVGDTPEQVADCEVMPLDEIDVANTVVINMDVVDSADLWRKLRARTPEPRIMNFLWWNVSERHRHPISTALLGLSLGMFPTFANSQRTAEEAEELVQGWTVPEIAGQARMAAARLGVHHERVHPRREPETPVVLYPAIYVTGRKRPWDFIDVVSAVEKRTPIRVQMRLHDQHLTAEAAMEMSTRNWAEVAPLLPREEYWQALASTTAFLATAVDESYGLEYVEAMASGAIGVFPDREWVHELLPDDYPFIYHDLHQAQEMLYQAVTDPASCRAQLDDLVEGSFIDWVRAQHDDAEFATAVVRSVREWFG